MKQMVVQHQGCPVCDTEILAAFLTEIIFYSERL